MGELRFRRERGTPRGAPWGLIGLLAVVTVLLVARAMWPVGPPPVLVEVAGDVPAPGTYPLAEPTIHEAIRAAGGDPAGRPDAPVPAGHRVEVTPSEARVLRPSDPVLVGLPIDPNTASAHELAAIPGVDEELAARIVADRQQSGGFRDLAALRRVSGVGPQTLERLEPFVRLSPVGPLDLNSATASELEGLPGIGPVLAARIVVDRAENGAYGEVADLARVEGVGPALLDAIAPLVAVR
jgi:competence protein ComEA